MNNYWELLKSTYRFLKIHRCLKYCALFTIICRRWTSVHLFQSKHSIVHSRNIFELQSNFFLSSAFPLSASHFLLEWKVRCYVSLPCRMCSNHPFTFFLLGWASQVFPSEALFNPSLSLVALLWVLQSTSLWGMSFPWPPAAELIHAGIALTLRLWHQNGHRSLRTSPTSILSLFKCHCFPMGVFCLLLWEIFQC